MRFRNKIIVVYTLFSLLIMILFMGSYYYITRENVIEQECENVEILSEQMSRQYEEMLNFMETAYRYIVKDTDVLEAIRQLSKLPEEMDYTSFYFANATELVQEALYSDYIDSNFYQVVFFNQRGVTLSSSWEAEKSNPNVNNNSFEWLAEVDRVPYGEFYIRGIHLDDWGKVQGNVFSIVKRIQGDNRGYVEVQKSVDDLNNLFEFAENDTKVVLLDSQLKILYSSSDSQGDGGYHSFVSKENMDGSVYINEITGEREFVAGRISVGGTILLVIKSSENMKSQLNYTFMMILVFAAVFIGIALIYICVSAKQLTRPVEELKQLMVLTELNPTEGKVGLKTGGNEFEIMGESYQSMLNHLNKAMEREKRISLSQLQAQFDALQAQVNPHFIYNVLNVISGRGLVDGDEVICDICDDLAKILRYSTDTRERYATIQQECAYLESYFKLLKNRYGHKLEYSIEIAPEIENRIVPKLVLQQFAENSILHGFEQQMQVMRIEICGWQDETGWYIRIRDNGDGFSERVLSDMQDRMEKTRKQINDDIQNVELKIGGMGITNTYARLCLLYAANLKFQIENYEQGAEILFGEIEG